MLKQIGKFITVISSYINLLLSLFSFLETLRKYPAVQNLDRVCTKQYKLNDHVTIEKGTPVYVNCVALQYDEKSFPNPQEWRPKRMENVQETDNLQFTFLPFGDGPRFCIGMTTMCSMESNTSFIFQMSLCFSHAQYS